MLLRMVFVTALFLSSHAFIFSQQTNSGDSIRIEKDVFTGMKFYKGDQKISMSNLTQLMQPNPEAYSYIRKAKSNNTIGTIFGVIGGALVGYELGKSFGGGKINGAVIGAGIGCIVVAIPFSVAGGRNTKKAVSLYNAAFR